MGLENTLKPKMRKEDQTCAFHDDLEKVVTRIAKKLDKLTLLVIINIGVSMPKFISTIKGLF